MKNITLNLHDGKTRTVEPRIELYTVRDFIGFTLPGIGIVAYDPEEGDDYVLTVSFGDYISMPDAFYVDTNNFPEAGRLLEESGIAEPTGLTRNSGFCSYPLYHFTEAMAEQLKTENSRAGRNYRHYHKFADAYGPDMDFDNFPEFKPLPYNG